MKQWLALVGISLAIAGTLHAGLLVHRAYGINLPWERPWHLDICEMRYDPVQGYPSIPESRILRLRPTILSLPFPLPEVHGDRPDEPYGGCPSIVVLVLPDREITYAKVQGGP